MQMLNPLNERAWAYPALECIHILAIAGGVGTAVLMNLRLLGIALTQNKAPRLWADLRPWTLSGLALAILAGLLLFSIDPSAYYANWTFRLKMLALILAVGFYYTAVRKTVANPQPRARSIVACVSLVLWMLIPFGGIFIEFLPSVYPVLLSLHVVALIVLGGMIVATDLRMLGIGLRSYSISDVVDALRIPKRVTFAVVAGCGVALFWVRAESYAENVWFWIKMALLVLIAANYLIFRRAAYGRPGSAKTSAALSLILWTATVFAARGPASVKDMMHAMVDPSGDFLFQSVQMISDEHGIREKAPRTEQEWNEVRQRAQLLWDAPDLLRGRIAARPRDRSSNPDVENQPEEIQQAMDRDRPDFDRRARKLQEAASVAMKAVDARDKDALLAALDGIDKACEGCHVRYWYPKDKRAVEAAKQDGLIP